MNIAVRNLRTWQWTFIWLAGATAVSLALIAIGFTLPQWLTYF